MKIEEVKYYCDICKKEIDYKDFFRMNYPVVFTRSLDGVSTPPYIGQRQIDLCHECASKVLKITSENKKGNCDYRIID